VVTVSACALGLLKLGGLTDMWSDDQPKCLLVAGVKHRCSWQAASTSFEASGLLLDDAM
jgi:hypothetical protein